jgi:hypothetical protein
MSAGASTRAAGGAVAIAGGSGSTEAQLLLAVQ